MPELPEVETVVRDLRPHLKGKSIASVEVRLTKIVKQPVALFRRAITGQRVIGLRRRAKIVCVEFDSGVTMLIHLKMSGQLVYVSSGGLMQYGGHPIVGGLTGLPNQYTHLIFTLSDGGHVYFNDLRQFGYLLVVPTAELEDFFAAKQLGLEPFDRRFTFAHFLAIAKRRPASTIKSLLLDQSTVAGLGNIYVDEVLFAAKIRPSRRVKSLSLAELERVWQQIPAILKFAIGQRGTTFRTFRGGTGKSGNMLQHLKVYGREGEKCRRCRQAAIIRVKQNGRSSHYCPRCQK